MVECWARSARRRAWAAAWKTEAAARKVMEEGGGPLNRVDEDFYEIVRWLNIGSQPFDLWRTIEAMSTLRFG
jgi:hypothetical protein